MVDKVLWSALTGLQIYLREERVGDCRCTSGMREWGGTEDLSGIREWGGTADLPPG